MAASSFVPLRCRVGGRAFHTMLYARAHASRADDTSLPAKRTLFVLNVPLGATEDDLEAAFSPHGDVASVQLGHGVGGAADARSAHVVFSQAAGLRKALSSTGKPISLAASAVACGSGSSAGAGLSSGHAVTETAEEEEGSLPHARRRSFGPAAAAQSRDALQAMVGTFLERFEADEAQRRADDDARHNAMDDDGFVVVTRKRTGRSTTTDASSGATIGVVSAASASAAAAGDAAPVRKKKKKMEMDGFYHFQQHEKKREGLMKMREQFERDKERIAKMRAERRFKPAGY